MSNSELIEDTNILSLILYAELLLLITVQAKIS